MTYKAREIRPSPPDQTVGGLLVFASARILPLSPGEIHSGYGGDHSCLLIAATQGGLTVSSHAQYCILEPGQAVVLYQCGAFTVQSLAGGISMLAELQGEIPGRLLLDKLTDGAALFPQGGPPVREAVMALSILEDEQGIVSGSVASALAYTMLTQLLSGKIAGPDTDTGSRFSPLVESAISIIQEEFPFLEGLDELAERLEVSKAHLIRTFTEKTGVSPGKYITRVRVEYAKLLLRDRDASITYVAEACGFANANYFAKVFRRETGMSPSEYLESVPRQETKRYSGFGPPLW